MLGELYKPSGLARETAQAVLEVKEPYACNVADGCSNMCTYCYVPKFMRRKPSAIVRHPKRSPVELVAAQLDFNKLPKRPEGVFLSFLTDPFLKENEEDTELLIEMLRCDYGIDRIATSSKCGTSLFPVRHGMTVVSTHLGFWRTFEPNAPSPQVRIEELEDRGYTWFSLEPYPVSAIWQQNILELLEQIKFADLIIFGKWNYNKRANTPQARNEYAENIHILRDFCKSHDIRLHIKSDTLKFTGMEKDRT